MHISRAVAALGVILAAALAAPAVGAAQDGRIGPDAHTTGNGRLLKPLGALTALGNFPTGSALTPDGRTLWAVNSGHGKNSVSVVDVATGNVVQTLPLPGPFGGVAITPDGTRAYVSGTPAPDDPAAKQDGLKGEQGDVADARHAAALTRRRSALSEGHERITGGSHAPRCAGTSVGRTGTGTPPEPALGGHSCISPRPGRARSGRARWRPSPPAP